MRVDVHCSEVQYYHHLAPVMRALGEHLGTVTVSEQLASIVPNAQVGYPVANSNLTLVASFQDSRVVRTRGRRAIYLEHGAGQIYVTDPHPSYSGGPEHEGTVMFLCPREEVALRWRGSYPDVAAVVIGSPRMDELMKLKDRPEWREKDGCTVAIAFHSDVRLCPESASAWTEYNYQLKTQVDLLHAEGITVLGHAHPRIFRHIKAYLEAIGVEPVENIEDAYLRADVYAVDNSSTLYEATALGISTVAINASWYRRDVEHGLRFWSQIPGIECDSPFKLASTLRMALNYGDHWADKRREISEYVWGSIDGKSADRAVEAITDLEVGTLDP